MCSCSMTQLLLIRAMVEDAIAECENLLPEELKVTGEVSKVHAQLFRVMHKREPEPYKYFEATQPLHQLYNRLCECIETQQGANQVSQLTL